MRFAFLVFLWLNYLQKCGLKTIFKGGRKRVKTTKGSIADLKGLNSNTSFVYFSLVNKDLVAISNRKNLHRRRLRRRVQ